jgi:hypothetical protein
MMTLLEFSEPADLALAAKRMKPSIAAWRPGGGRQRLQGMPMSPLVTSRGICGTAACGGRQQTDNIQVRTILGILKCVHACR